MKKYCLNVVKTKSNECVALVRGKVVKGSIRSGGADDARYANLALSIEGNDKQVEYLCKLLDAKVDMKKEFNGKNYYTVRVSGFRFVANTMAEKVKDGDFIQCFGVITKGEYNDKNQLDMITQSIEFANDNAPAFKPEAKETATTATTETEVADAPVDIDLSDCNW